MKNNPAFFEQHEIRRVYDEKAETWWFSVVDIMQVLTQQADYQTARKYWNKLNPSSAVGAGSENSFRGEWYFQRGGLRGKLIF